MSANATATAMRPEAEAGDAELTARAALRDQIARRDMAAAELAQAEQAHQAAFDRAVAVGSEIEDVAERKRWPEGRFDDSEAGDVLVSALIAGHDLPSAVTPGDEALRALKVEHAALRQARERLAPVIAARKGQLEFAEQKVLEAARAVLVSSGAIERLSNGLPELIAETIRRRSALSFIASCMPHRSAEASALTDLVLDHQPVSVQLSTNAEQARCREALKELCRDPDPKLPEAD